MTNLAEEVPEAQESSAHKLAQFVTTIGLGLVAVVILLCIVNVVLAVTLLRSLSHLSDASLYPRNQLGMTAKRKDAEVLVGWLIPFVCPLVVAGLGLDWLGTKLDRRLRLSLVGYIGTIVGVLSLLVLLLTLKGH